MGSGSTRRPSGLYSKILQDPSFGPTEMSRLQPQVALAKSWLLSNQGQAPIETVAPITALIDCRDVDKQLIFFFCKCHLEGVLYLSLQGASNYKSLTNTQSTLPSLGQITPGSNSRVAGISCFYWDFSPLWWEMGKAFTPVFWLRHQKVTCTPCKRN